MRSGSGENILKWVAAGVLAWQGLADTGAWSHDGLYQRSGQTTTVAMGMFQAFLEAQLTCIAQRFEGAGSALAAVKFAV